MDSMNLDCLRPISRECNNVGVEPPYDDLMNPSSEPCPLNSIIEEEAHDFYKNYVKKVGFVIKIRKTNHVINAKGEKIPINQSIHCNREGNRMS
ncbi:hypothetical protein PIB30_049929 [Stylosanthes scabra]|uniref:FAR1 domain-containing protein n=1 Tax=Stylosanthes scabra TaxID=79078 RepID=A0ABU6RHL5_9FABA|nr:hypothetical protein [Stylosanthes scabra]